MLLLSYADDQSAIARWAIIARIAPATRRPRRPSRSAPAGRAIRRRSSPATRLRGRPPDRRARPHRSTDRRPVVGPRRSGIGSAARSARPVTADDVRSGWIRRPVADVGRPGRTAWRVAPRRPCVAAGGRPRRGLRARGRRGVAAAGDGAAATVTVSATGSRTRRPLAGWRSAPAPSRRRPGRGGTDLDRRRPHLRAAVSPSTAGSRPTAPLRS